MTSAFREASRIIRQLVVAPSFSLPAVVGLAIGIGATTAVFSVFSAMLLRTMGVAEPAQVVAIWQSDQAHAQERVEIAYNDLVEWRKARDVFSEVALASSVNLDFPLFSGGEPEHVDGTTVTGNFFRALGAAPLAGRFFTNDDDRPGAPLRAVISYRLWRAKFGGDFQVVGRHYRVGPDSITVIGVAPPEFDFPRDVSMWVPLRAAWPTVEKSGTLRVFRSVARLAPGVTPAQAAARLAVISRQVESTLPAGVGRYRPVAIPLLDEIYGAARAAIALLMGSVFVVLLIACANAANLLLARAADRSRELAIRTALGAGRVQILRMLLGESTVLAVVAGILGIGVAAMLLKILVVLAPEEIPRIAQAGLDGTVLTFGVTLTFATVLIFGLIPAVLSSDHDPSEALKQSGPRVAGGVNRRLRRGLIVTEVAMSTVLLVGAGLLLRTFTNLSSIDPGFNAERILTFRITSEKPDQESRRALYTQVLDRIRSLPGVESAGAILLRPLSGTVGWDTVYAVEGQAPVDAKANPNGNYEAVSPDYFRTMRIRLAEGRDFTPSDGQNAAGVVIVNESTARRHWPVGGAVGRHLRLSHDERAPWLTVVGVVADVRYREWEAVRPDFYVPLTQRAQHRSDFVVRTHGDPWAIAAAVRREVFAVDKSQPISNLTTMEHLVDQALARSRFNGFTLSVLAASALLLAAIGIYGVLSYSVVQRTREIGVRLAVGATAGQIVRLVTADGMTLVGMGLVVGLAIAAIMRGVVGALLYGVKGSDPWTYLSVAGVLLTVAVAACLGPSLRAANIQPVRALQS